ncbi:MAG: GTP 3',8-cyclase MoaA [Desulfovibrionaceae bacterium]|nr:GTP 3',8-cyclase MoaA [Desulfovibrionaceae bacterium]MBF0514007.1 GTP 3',8-cyclase MoaA [Desulfovibrionaceae bacterium]
MVQDTSDTLTDTHNRTVRYLRLSITDRCNLRCLYCRGGKDFFPMAHENVLRYEELARLIRVAASLHIDKVRLTGGEPLTRRGFFDFLDMARAAAPLASFRLTTNGVLLPGLARRLDASGIAGINISLDTLRPEKYREITGHDGFAAVRRGIDEAIEAGLRVKINAVALRGVNEDDLPGFIELARRLPLDVRLIEFMPVGGESAWSENLYWNAGDILARANQLAELVPDAERAQCAGPAKMWRIAGGAGRFGLITALSGHFCDACNRLRVTSDGRLRTCLFSDKEYRLAGVLRNAKLSDGHLRRIIALASKNKPLGHDLLLARQARSVCLKRMSAIGG